MSSSGSSSVSGHSKKKKKSMKFGQFSIFNQYMVSRDQSNQPSDIQSQQQQNPPAVQNNDTPLAPYNIPSSSVIQSQYSQSQSQSQSSSRDVQLSTSGIQVSPSNPQRLIINTASGKFECDRLCPHKQADLSSGWLDIEDQTVLVCPKHKWKFKLDSQSGVCIKNNGKHPCSNYTLNATRIN
ncbi:hypothetical protein MP228_009503 [Amoeboaphelidium protococcarum]|nr:hypothetical protein MP228_009503 [Amoeboaphelidium protococcarum]